MCLFNNVLFLSYFLTLTPSVIGFVDLPAMLVSELGSHVGILLSELGLNYIERERGREGEREFAWLSDCPPPIQNPGYATERHVIDYIHWY